MSEIKRYDCAPCRGTGDAIMVETKNGPCVMFHDHDAAIADKDKTIADLKRQLEDMRDRAFEEAALILENNVCNLNKSGELISEPRYGKEDVVRRSYANAIRAIKSNQK